MVLARRSCLTAIVLGACIIFASVLADSVLLAVPNPLIVANPNTFFRALRGVAVVPPPLGVAYPANSVRARRGLAAVPAPLGVAAIPVAANSSHILLKSRRDPSRKHGSGKNAAHASPSSAAAPNQTVNTGALGNLAAGAGGDLTGGVPSGVPDLGVGVAEAQSNSTGTPLSTPSAAPLAATPTSNVGAGGKVSSAGATPTAAAITTPTSSVPATSPPDAGATFSSPTSSGSTPAATSSPSGRASASVSTSTSGSAPASESVTNAASPLSTSTGSDEKSASTSTTIVPGAASTGGKAAVGPSSSSDSSNGGAKKIALIISGSAFGGVIVLFVSWILVTSRIRKRQDRYRNMNVDFDPTSSTNRFSAWFSNNTTGSHLDKIREADEKSYAGNGDQVNSRDGSGGSVQEWQSFGGSQAPSVYASSSYSRSDRGGNYARSEGGGMAPFPARSQQRGYAGSDEGGYSQGGYAASSLGVRR